MLSIRFIRKSKKNQPFYRIIVTDKKNASQGGRFVEKLGFYNPLTKETNLEIERIKYWLGVGAQPSDTVHNLLVKKKVIEAKKIAVHKKASSSSKKQAGDSSDSTVSVQSSPPSIEETSDKEEETSKKEEEISEKEES